MIICGKVKNSRVPKQREDSGEKMTASTKFRVVLWKIFHVLLSAQKTGLGRATDDTGRQSLLHYKRI